MSGPERVAVVIPTYNHAAFLKTALSSAFAQTVRPHEVIVVDDGSTDDPATVVRDYPGARLIRQANKGLAAARNTGWRACQSEWLVFLDADDRLRPQAIARNLELFAAAPECGFVYGAYRKVFTATGAERMCVPKDRGADAFAGFLAGNRVGMHATVMYRRAVLAEFDGFDPAFRACEDYDLYLRIARRYPVACHPEVLADYVIHGKNMSRRGGVMLTWALRALEKQRPAADGRPAWRAALQAGEAGWTQYYAEEWFASLRAMRGVTDLIEAFRQAKIISGVDRAALPCALRRRLRPPRLRRAARRIATSVARARRDLA
ncbi:glycosyltransferase family 2 protein [Phenylobacterium sp.]|jgi:GT2 family glycosyltransferase|uniref:glycosyltransferase family 2 protein n=1 Tax=Phenylobacterium sp. TaxID=1871053 RepID=UPI003782D506